MSDLALIAEETTEAILIYFSSKSENTRRMASKLQVATKRLPIRANDPKLVATKPFVLMTPCFADATGRGAVPKPVIHFLNDQRNRGLLRGVIASGNRNFGESFALAGEIIAKKCGVPVLYRFELAGNERDVENIERGLGLFLPATQ